MATQSSILARIILWTQKHVGQHSAAAAAKLLQWCPTLRPHRRQPTRLPHPWDSPGKNTGVGCHFFLQCMKVRSESEVALRNPMDCSLPGSSIHGIFQARVLEWGAIAFSVNTIQMLLNSLSAQKPPLKFRLIFLLKSYCFNFSKFKFTQNS